MTSSRSALVYADFMVGDAYALPLPGARLEGMTTQAAAFRCD
jgi:hypothetical protein